MCRKYCLAGGKGIHILVEVLYLLTILVGSTETCGIGDVAHGSTCLAYCLYDTGKVFVVSTSCILGIELHVLHIALGILHGSHGTLYDFLWSAVEFILDMRRACTNTRMYTAALGILQSLGGHVNIFLHGTCQCTDGGPCHGLADFYN